MRWSDYEWARELFESGSSGASDTSGKKGTKKRDEQLSFDFDAAAGSAKGGDDESSGRAEGGTELPKEHEPQPGSFAARLSRYLDLQQDAARRGKDRKRYGLDR